MWGACVSGLGRVALYLALRFCWWCWRDDGDDRSFAAGRAGRFDGLAAVPGLVRRATLGRSVVALATS